MFKKMTTLAFLACSTIALTGCLDDDDDNNEAPPVGAPIQTGEVRVFHASPDAPAVNINAGGAPILSMQGVNFQEITSLLPLSVGSYDLTVDAILPDGSTTQVIAATAVLEADKEYTVVAVGDTAAIEPLVIVNDESAIGAGNVRAQVLHAAPDAPTVDVYVTAPDADLASEQPLATLSFKDFTGQVEVPGGDYQIRITLAGETTVVYDSGTVALAAGADLFIAALENVAAGDSPVALAVAGSTGANVLLDANTQAEVRAIHAIAAAPVVDVIVDVEEGDDITLFDAVAFKDVSDFISVEGDSYVLDVVADADNSVVAINDVPVTVTNGLRYTAIANNLETQTVGEGEEAEEVALGLDFFVENARRLATAAQVRIFHASPATGGVDIYVTSDGMIADVDPAFTNVEYDEGSLQNTGFVALTPGEYHVTVTVTGTKDVAIATGALMLEGNGIYTALAVDGDMEGDDPQLILADDFVAEAEMVVE